MVNELHLGSSVEKLGSDLIDACAAGDLSRLTEIWPQYLSVDPNDVPTPQYLLKTAARNGQAGALRMAYESLPTNSRCRHPWDTMMLRGVDFDKVPDKWSIYEDDIIKWAIEGNSNPVDIFKVFFEYGMEVDHSLGRDQNTTAYAIVQNKVDLVKFLLSQGAKPDGKVYIHPEDSYLGSAARYPQSDMLKLLLVYGSRLEGSQVLRQAALWGQVHNAKILLDAGVDVNEVFMKYNYSDDTWKPWGCALHFAIHGLSHDWRQNFKSDMVRFLLSRGAKLEVVDGEGNTPLQIAEKLNEESIIQILKVFQTSKALTESPA